jgi:hypothetical protein
MEHGVKGPVPVEYLAERATVDQIAFAKRETRLIE